MQDIYEKIVSEKHIGKEANPINQYDIFSLASNYARNNSNNKSNGIGLVIIDIQRDFVDPKRGALPVKGAVKDVQKIIRFIYENLEDIYGIYISMDTHYYDSIFHPYMWKKPNGETGATPLVWGQEFSLPEGAVPTILDGYYYPSHQGTDFYHHYQNIFS